MKNKMIPARDFWYLCTLLVLILITVTTMVLSDSKRAGDNLNFAATMVSIVLAVIAIIMTIVDSAGQKQNIVQLSDSVSELGSTIADVKEILNQTSVRLSEVQGLKNEFVSAIKSNDQIREHLAELKQLIHEQKQGDIENISPKVEQKINEMESLTLKNIRSAIAKHISQGESVFKIYDVTLKLNEDFPTLQAFLSRVINYLNNVPCSIFLSPVDNEDLKVGDIVEMRIRFVNEQSVTFVRANLFRRDFDILEVFPSN